MQPLCRKHADSHRREPLSKLATDPLLLLGSGMVAEGTAEQVITPPPSPREEPERASVEEGSPVANAPSNASSATEEAPPDVSVE